MKGVKERDSDREKEKDRFFLKILELFIKMCLIVICFSLFKFVSFMWLLSPSTILTERRNQF